MGLFAKLTGRQKLIDKVSALEEKVSATSVALGAWVGPRGAIWPDRNYDIFAREGYLKNLTTFRAIKEIAVAFCSVNWDLFRKNSDGKRERVEEDHPVKRLLRRPNPEESWAFLMMKAVSFLKLAGNNYFESVAPLTGPNQGTPQELYVLRPNRMKVLVDTQTGLIKGYEYDINGRKVEWDVDLVTRKSPILQVKTFHPLNDWYGLADTEPTSRDIDTSNSATAWKKNMMDNEGRAGMVIGLGESITDEQFDQLVKGLEEHHEGPQNAGKTMIMRDVKTVKPYSFKPKEMDFLKSDLELMRRIAIGFGVPPMIIGIPGEATFANFGEAVIHFWDTTILSLLVLFKGELNNWIFGADNEDLFLDFTLDDIPALAPRREKMWKRAQEADFLKINEKREMVGKEEVEGGDVILVDSGKMPLDLVGEESDESEDEARQRLANEGYTQEEINLHLGYPKDGNVADKSCNHTVN